MSARLNFNPIRYFSWKGKTFNQIISSIQNNNKLINNIGVSELFKPLPLKIYRREIASVAPSVCNVRISSSIDVLDQPNGSLVSSNNNYTGNGLVNVLDINLTENESERPGNCSTTAFCTETNARRRVRSSGMIKRTYNPEKNNDTYYTSSSQYLISRNRTFQQNQYNYIRQGDSGVKPGSAQSSGNVYSANGISHCKRAVINQYNNTFQYTWGPPTASVVNVVIPDGGYDIDMLNSAFETFMIAQGHYFINKSTLTKIFLMGFRYNIQYDKIEMQIAQSETYYNNPSLYSPAYGATWNTATFTPTLTILNNPFQNVVGFPYATYTYSVSPILSTIDSTAMPSYVKSYYKPNNSDFAQQGAVSSSSLITRLKYNTITNNGAAYQSAFGKATANALAYGVPEGGYTIKDKIGYPMKKTPVISKYTGEVSCVVSGKVNGRLACK